MNKPRDPAAAARRVRFSAPTKVEAAPTDLHFLTLAQASRLIESKALSPANAFFFDGDRH